MRVLCFSQDSQEDVDFLEISDNALLNNDLTKEPDKKLKAGIDVGMSYMFSSSGYSGPSFMFSPHLDYQLTDRISLTGGVMAERGSALFYRYNGEHFEAEMLPMTQVFLYATGNYKLNENVTISSSVSKRIMDVPNNEQVEHKSTYDVSGMSVGVNYKLTPNITIGARISVESGRNALGNDLYFPYGGYYPGTW